jgi:energy-converting hydrogenase Eha subunit F
MDPNKMKKYSYFLIPVLFLSGFQFLFAAGIVGDCGTGATACTLSDLGGVIKNFLYFLLTIAVSVIMVIIIVTSVRVMYAKSADKPTELKEAKDKLIRMAIGLALIIGAATVTTYVAILSDIGVKSEFLKIFDIFKGKTSMIPYFFIEHAYATDTAGKLPNPTNIDNLYSFLLALIALFVKWVVYPLVVLAWFITGFLFVKAQGNPEKLNEAKKFLLYTFAGTVVILMAQGLAIAVKDTITQIFSS